MSSTFDVLKAKWGITDEQLAAGVEVDGDPYMGHAEFERGRYAEPTECEGSLRVQDDSEPIWTVKCDVCGFECGVQMRQADPERLLERQLSRAGIPEMFAGKHFEDVDQDQTLAACRIWLRNFKRGPLPAIALWGGPGRGKSHLLSLMVETLIRNHSVEAVYRTASVLFDELQAAMDGQRGDYDVLWQRVLRVPVLALDDLGAGRMTEWRQDRFAALVDHRYSKELPLLIATNIPPAAWEKVFGERTASRLRGMALPFKLDGPDRRQLPQTSLMDEAAA